MNRITVTSVVFLALTASFQLAAQQPTPQQNPLVTERKVDGDMPKTVWELTIPQRPDDRITKLTYERMLYAFSLIQEDKTKMEQFILAFTSEVKPGENAWENAENLALRYTDGRALSDPVPNVELTPNDIRIITTPEEIRKFYGLDPDRDFGNMDWQLDPVGDCLIKERKDILKNITAYEAKINQLYAQNPQAGNAIIAAARTCIAQPGDSDICFDKPMKEIVYLQRNHGKKAGSMGKNESYLKGTNRPDAHGTFFFVKGVGWKGIGWECCDNPLDPFTTLTIPAEVTVRLFHSSSLSCDIAPGEIKLNGLAEVASFNLTVTPPQKTDDLRIFWRLNSKVIAQNTQQLQILGSMLESSDSWIPVEARVAVGKTEAVCNARITLQFPPPPVPATTIRPPSCTMQVLSPILRNATDPWRVTITESNPDNVSVTSKNFARFAGSDQPNDYRVPQSLVFQGTRADFGKFKGAVSLTHSMTIAGGKEIVCAGQLATQEPSPEKTSRHFCGPAAIYCWGPPVVAGILCGTTFCKGSAATAPAPVGIKTGQKPGDGQ